MKRADRVLPENAYKASPQADNHTRAADFTPKGFHPEGISPAQRISHFCTAKTFRWDFQGAGP